MRYSLAKLIVSLLLVAWYFAMPVCGFDGYSDIFGHLLYPLSHANVWHLAANVLCLWMIPCDLNLTISFLLAVLCSFLPCFTSEATVGFSGVLFSIVGISWGRVRRFRDMIWRNKWFLLIPFFIPHINAFIHLYCLLAGWVVGRFCKRVKGDWL